MVRLSPAPGKSAAADVLAAARRRLLQPSARLLRARTRAERLTGHSPETSGWLQLRPPRSATAARSWPQRAAPEAPSALSRPAGPQAVLGSQRLVPRHGSPGRRQEIG